MPGDRPNILFVMSVRMWRAGLPVSYQQGHHQVPVLVS